MDALKRARSELFTPTSLLLIASTVFVAVIDGWDQFSVGFGAGVLFTIVVSTAISAETSYRRWYLLCRDTLEKIAEGEHAEEHEKLAARALEYIGPRTSKREEWEEEWL
jgi:hypothetical protein